jgi:hypothetical protein
MKKHLWQGHKRTACGVLAMNLPPENLEDKTIRVTCMSCLKRSGRVLDNRKRKPVEEPKLDVYVLDAEGPITDIHMVLWTRVFRHLGDAEKFANKASRGILGHTEDIPWKKRKSIWWKKVKEVTLTITKYRVS